MMMSASGTSTCGPECRLAAFSLMNEVTATTVPAGTSQVRLASP